MNLWTSIDFLLSKCVSNYIIRDRLIPREAVVWVANKSQLVTFGWIMMGELLGEKFIDPFKIFLIQG